jgi:hypothetical protein
MLSRFSSRRRFDELSEQEVLAIAISSEEDDARRRPCSTAWPSRRTGTATA